DDLVALHHAEADSSDPGIRLVVDEQVSAGIGAVGERDVRVMEIAVEPDAASALEKRLRFRQHVLGQDLSALVGEAPARRAAAVEHGDAHELAHRRTTDDAHLARLTAREEDVILVEFAGGDMRLVRRRRQTGAWLKEGSARKS